MSKNRISEFSHPTPSDTPNLLVLKLMETPSLQLLRPKILGSSFTLLAHNPSSNSSETFIGSIFKYIYLESDHLSHHPNYDLSKLSLSFSWITTVASEMILFPPLVQPVLHTNRQSARLLFWTYSRPSQLIQSPYTAPRDLPPSPTTCDFIY